MSDNLSVAESNFELAKLYFAKCEFDVAADKSKKAADAYFSKKDYRNYLKAQNILLRIYAEQDLVEKINETKEKLQDLVIKEGFELSPRTYYTLGICAYYKGQTEVALEYFQKALALALASDDKEEMCYAISGIAICFCATGKYQEALVEIYNLRVFFQILDVPEVKISTQILNGIILRNLGRYEEALQILGDTFDLLRVHKSLYMYILVIAETGETYRQAGNMDMARFYLQLAKRTADPKSLKRKYHQIDVILRDMGVSPRNEYDLVFNATAKSVVEKRKGRVDFKNQFILLDLLHLFLRKPGQVYSKESITERLWNEAYDPSVHDNKIYVTIKRLRQLIEPDVDNPHYIFRAKNGYYLNKDTKVMLEQ